MENEVIYEALLSKVQAELEPFGFKRSGKSTLFYRYSHDKKIACGLQMQKSMFNGPEGLSFTFNLLCICVKELKNYSKEHMTIAAIKAGFGDFRVFERIGSLCRGRDHWWNVTDEILSQYSLEDYYTRFIQKDILKTAQHLDIATEIKVKIYSL